MGTYDGKRAVITGGTSGIGLATAKLLLDGGARVLVTGRTQALLDSARAELGDRAIVLASDAASLADVDALAERAKVEFGALDLVFLNAGVAGFAPFESVTESAYDQLFATNVRGAYFAAQRLAPLVARGGAIVVTTSIANVKGIPMVSAYSASKAALRSLVRSLAAELAPSGVRVNAVSPGPIDTPILGKSIPAEAAEAARREFQESNPMKRMGRSEEVAQAVAFLAFEATYTTGAELPVDGGASQL
ncbi:NAD(P)-dependent dehydrogenase (short-subunit alcohol dehydrogenase family) [Roseiarcus fermentans]|uniref:NAD(P)-dependent dehydrogenase (Short-subunit alcohol dehydrogenase family) n=1 Tax=Roseiarcus fermentans TaxID=1473586 RepID=A0A366FEE2_9HYPH|nr:SDR family oxidoreductase [Roseiarcus fermentans]RBP12310.1 NAD(P)-dependent dehydrogenase (short-subunit alcohol dehydrogenase family) [Roseiarcus fermentans]